MIRERDDERMRAEFQALRAETRAGDVPDFGAMIAKAKADADARPELAVVAGGGSRVRRALLFGGWASVATAAAVAAVLLVQRGPDADAEFEALVASYSSSSTTWQSPTSRLMNVPGMELTRSVPSVGGAVRGIDPATLPPPPGEGRDS